jgi:hydrogenase maturation factor
LAEAIFAQMVDACDALGVSLAGGHTEITVNLDRPIISGTMLGEVSPERLITTAGARPGDAVMLVKPIPIEGTALVALERADTLRERGYPEPFITRAQRFLHDPGISVVAPALLAAASAPVHAMHDPTEGGVLTGLMEIGRAAGMGLTVDLDAIGVLPESEAICREFGLDPLGTLASGALLLSVEAAAAASLGGTLDAAGYPSAVIGQITEAGGELIAMRAGARVPWPEFAADEITKIFARPLPRTS